jgi:hypothetical protein
MSKNSSFQGTNTPTTGNTFSIADQKLNPILKDYWFGSREASAQEIANDQVSRWSNLGSSNPNKGPTARSLFYNAANLFGPDAKFGQFLFYSFSNNSNTFRQEYYQSEQTQFNSSISSISSKNPSAGQLVRAANEIRAAILPGQIGSTTNTGNNTTGSPGKIIGGASAPYYWRDFLYCKYYGTIPNNYMITLRRFPAPMRDNLSIPSQLIQTDLYKQKGAGMPVAQAVTWWGGQTGNTLNDIISFSTGLVFQSKTQEEILKVEGFDQGFFKTVLGRALGTTADLAGASQLFGALGDSLSVLVSASDSGRGAVTIPKINQALRDKMQNTSNGPLSDFIFNPVDTVDKTYYRGRGLTFSGGPIYLKFHYELTSVGQVNTKAALVDIIGNLLGLGTNYGNFLTPDVRYDNGFPAIGFPGGDQGLKAFYSDPIKWVKTTIKYLADPDGTTMDDPQVRQLKKFTSDLQTATNQVQSMLQQIDSSGGGIEKLAKEIEGPLGNILAYALADDLIAKFVPPLSLKTGAPVGEWHLVVGNPMNPIAMIGNLICSNLDIEFGEVLGPDDFPTEIIATFTLEHGRDRERGEIESMFNRGDGRLYQSTLPTYSNTQSTASTALTDGTTVPYDINDSTLANPYLFFSDNNFTPGAVQNNFIDPNNPIP